MFWLSSFWSWLQSNISKRFSFFFNDISDNTFHIVWRSGGFMLGGKILLDKAKEIDSESLCCTINYTEWYVNCIVTQIVDLT